MAKPKGGQPGNTNALKHGFYSRYFNAAELIDIETIDPELTAEIAMLRVTVRRLFERVSALETTDKTSFNIDDYTALVSLLSSSTIRLSSLIRTNHFLTGKGTNLGEILKEALESTIQELNLT